MREADSEFEALAQELGYSTFWDKRGNQYLEIETRRLFSFWQRVKHGRQVPEVQLQLKPIAFVSQHDLRHLEERGYLIAHREKYKPIFHEPEPQMPLYLAEQEGSAT